MKKKILGITLVLLALIAIGTVFAQVCYGPTAAYVELRGSSVYVLNKMNDAAINVQVKYTYRPKNGLVDKSDFAWANNLAASSATTLPLKEGTSHKLTGYEVQTCYTP